MPYANQASGVAYADNFMYLDIMMISGKYCLARDVLITEDYCQYYV